MDKKFLSIKAVATALGLSVVTVWRGVLNKEIPGIRVGHKWLVPRKWLDEQLASAGVTE